MRTLILRTIAIAAIAAVLGVGGALAWLKAHESELVFATAQSRLHLVQTLPGDLERVQISTADGSRLPGIVFAAGRSGTADWILLLHGNAESAFSRTQVRHGEALRAAGFNVLSFDYRGFGPSPGEASEQHMNEDAEAALAALIDRGVAPDRIIVLGHSLGSGPAVLLATHHPIAALVLFGAFTSIPDAAAERYPYLPVRYAASVQFDSLARIGTVKAPVIIAHSPTDEVIPYSEGLRLFAAAHEPKRLITLTSPSPTDYGGHVDALFEHLDLLRAALTSVLPAAGSEASASP